MPSVPFNIYSGAVPGSDWFFGTCVGFYLKIPAMPAQQTALVDFDGGTVVFARISLTPGGLLPYELLYRGLGGTVDACGGVPLVPNVWYWVAFQVGTNPTGFDGGTLVYMAQVWAPGGATPGLQYVNTNVQGARDGEVQCELGIGKSLTGGYAPFPNDPGWEMSKLVEWRHFGERNWTQSDIVITPPNSDITGPYYAGGQCGGGHWQGTCGYEFAYNARQLSGPASFLLDCLDLRPGAPSLSATGSGSSLGPGVYTVGLSGANTYGTSYLGATAQLTLAAGQNLVVTVPGTNGTPWTAFDVYASVAPGSGTLGRAVQGVLGGATATLSAPGGVVPPPASNSAGGYHTAALSTPPGLSILTDGPFP